MEQNQNVISELIKQLSGHGVGWLFAGLILLGFFVILYKKILSNPKIQDAFAYWFSSKVYKVSMNDIKRHFVFTNKSKLLNKVDLLNFDDEPVKTKVFRVFFKTKSEVDTEQLNAFVNQDFRKIDKDELHIKMTATVEEMKSNFDKVLPIELEKLCKKMFYSVTGDLYNEKQARQCAERIFNYVMYEPKGYEEFRTFRIDSLMYDIELIKDSPIYDNNNERVYQFLSTVGHSIEKAIMRASKTFQDFNGEIESIFNEHIKMINES